MQTKDTVFLGLIFIALTSSASAASDTLALRIHFDLKDDVVRVSSLSWISKKGKIPKTDIRDSKKRGKADREFNVEVIDSKGSVKDKVVLRLSSSLFYEPDNSSDEGEVINDRYVNFPCNGDLISLRVTKDQKIIFDKKFAEVIAAYLHDYQSKRDVFGSRSLKAFLLQKPYSPGREREYFEGLLSATEGCTGLRGDNFSDCSFLERSARRALDHAFPK